MGLKYRCEYFSPSETACGGRHQIINVHLRKEIMKKKIWGFLLAGVLAFASAGMSFTAVHAEDLMPERDDNVNYTYYDTYSYLAVRDSGYIRVMYKNSQICVDILNQNFSVTAKKKISLELPLYGGFYAGKDGNYYIVEGQKNEKEDNSAEVIRIIKYDHNFNRAGAASIHSDADLWGAQVRTPFRSGGFAAEQNGNTLLIAVGHEGYVDPAVGQGHQGLLLMQVNTDTMTGGLISGCDLWHSFDQHLTFDGTNYYLQEMSEGSRCTTVKKISTDENGSLSRDTILDLVQYGGTRTSAWAIPIYATTDGITTSSSNVLSIGTEIDASKYDSVSTSSSYNIYLTVTPKNNFTEDASSVKMLTNYQDAESGNTGIQFVGTSITKISDDRFLVTWEIANEKKESSTENTLEGHTLHYVFVNGNGEKVSKEFTAAAPYAECKPILNNGKAVYYASDGYSLDYYTIDGTTGEFTRVHQETAKMMYRLYNPNSGEHFYTASKKEYSNLISLGWRDEGIGWIAPAKTSTPVFRLYNKNGGEHHYTLSEDEKNTLVKAGWTYEGIGWYSDDAKSIPLYRQYNPNAFANNHNYTTSKDENDWLVSLGWRAEGIGWYGIDWYSINS
jgi:hypothetical protein